MIKPDDIKKHTAEFFTSDHYCNFLPWKCARNNVLPPRFVLKGAQKKISFHRGMSL